MSKLVDKLNQVGKTSAQPLGFGFRTTAATRPSQMVLVVSLPGNDVDLARAALEHGADALRVHVDIEEHTSGVRFGPLDRERQALEAILKEAGDKPVGIVAGLRAETLSEIDQLGFDFISVYAQHAPSSFLRLEKLGRGLIVDSTYSDTMLRLLNEMPFDMVEADVLPPESDGQQLTVHDVMQYIKLGMLVRKPLLVPSQRVITPDDLPVLQEAGAKGIVLGFVVTGDTPDELGRVTADFRKAIDQLKPVRGIRGDRDIPLLPRPTPRAEQVIEDDDDE